MIDTITSKLEHAVKLVGTGKVAEAETILRKILETEPENAVALNLLGEIALHAGAKKPAENLFQKAVINQPKNVDFLKNLGVVKLQSNDLSGAKETFEKALSLAPDDQQIKYNLALTLVSFGQPLVALELFQALQKQFSNDSDIELNIGIAYIATGNFSKAKSQFEKALNINPNNPGGRQNLANVLFELGEYNEAKIIYGKLIQEFPDNVALKINLGKFLGDNKEFDEAEKILAAAVSLAPDGSEPLMALGNLYEAMHSYESAANRYKKACEINPSDHKAFNNLGRALARIGDKKSALAAYDKSMELSSDDPFVRYNRGFVHLSLGNLAEGWTDFEARLKVNGTHIQRHYQDPDSLIWNGTPLDGKKMLIRHEQGLGDTLQFSRFIPKFVENFGEVSVEVQKPLHRLMSSSTELSDIRSSLTDKDVEQEFDVVLDLMSLPFYLKISPKDIARCPSIISAPQNEIDFWQEKLSSYQGFKIGVFWQGNPRHSVDHYRSVSLKRFYNLGKIEKVDVFGLQRGFGSEQLMDLPTDVRIFDLGKDYSGSHTDMATTAGLLSNLDLVITIDSAPGHLSGSLGIPTYLLLKKYGDWRYFEKGTDTSWYPNHKIYQQEILLDWDQIFLDLEFKVRDLINKWSTS